MRMRRWQEGRSLCSLSAITRFEIAKKLCRGMTPPLLSGLSGLTSKVIFQSQAKSTSSIGETLQLKQSMASSLALIFITFPSSSPPPWPLWRGMNLPPPSLSTYFWVTNRYSQSTKRNVTFSFFSFGDPHVESSCQNLYHINELYHPHHLPLTFGRKRRTKGLQRATSNVHFEN